MSQKIKTDLVVDGTVTATTFVKSSGTSSQFLKADGSVDSNTYLTASTKVADSELLDGLDSSLFIYGNNSTGTSFVSGATLDTALKSGFYTTDGGVPNATSVNFVLHNAYYAPGNLAGFDLACNDSTTSSFYLRPATGGGKGAWQTIITTSNISSQSVNYAVSAGAATTSITFVSDRTNYKGYTDNAVAGQLMWKQYGNLHTIFDASAGTSPSGTTVSRHTPDYPVLVSDGNNSWGVNPNLMAWNGANTYGVKVDWSRYSETSGSASTLGGYSPNQTGGANTIVQRDANGYIQNSYFYTSGGGSERNGSGISYVAGFNSGDYYIRSYTMQGLASAMSGVTMNISGSATTSSTTTHYAGRVDGTWYNVVWAAGNPSHLYSSDAVQIQSSTGSIRANVFYDSNDTAYYVDPNSTSSINELYLAGAINYNGSVSTDSGYGLYFGSSRDSAYGIFREPGAWSYPFPDLRIAFHTGIKLGANSGYSGIRFFTDYDMGTQVMSVNNGGDGYGAGHVHVNNIMNAGGSVRAPIFYDNNDTTYYVDPASDARVRKIWIDNGGAGGVSWSSGLNMGDSSNYWNLIQDNGTARQRNFGTGGYDWFNNSASTQIMVLTNGGDLTTSSSHRAPIFYDSNDTAYYVDPTGTSRLNRLYLSQRNDNYNVGSLAGLNPVNDWQSLTNTDGQWTVAQYNAIGSYANTPANVYTYGGVMSWRTTNHSFQLYAAHTGDLAFKTQWNNDGYSGWRSPVVYGVNGGSSSGKNIYGDVFYDSDNSVYYVDGTSTSRLNVVMPDYLRRANHHTGHLEGGYNNIGSNSTNTNPIFTIGSSYNPDSTTLANMYGVGYSNAAASFIDFAGETDWGFYVAADGDARIWLDGSSGNISAKGGVYAAAYRGSANVGGTGEATYHPAGIYSVGTQWLYGTTYRNGATTSGQGWLYIDTNYGHSIVGAYASTRYQGVFAMGDAYKLPADGTSIGNLYGMAWSHPNAGGVAGNLNTHGLLVTENGSFLAAVSGSIRSRDDMRAPIFYDSDNTGYYTNPASTSNLNSIAVNGSSDYYSTNYFYSNIGGYSGALVSPGLQVYSQSNNSAFMSFHKGGHYAVNMGLDADNVFRIGGWSMSSNRFQMDASGNLTMAGDVTAYSDARVKENVVTIENALEKVLKSRGVYYNRTDSDDKKTKVGVIAQEILEVIPEVVNQDNDGLYNVSYGNITAVLIEAIKEQQKQIEELKAIVNGLTK